MSKNNTPPTDEAAVAEVVEVEPTDDAAIVPVTAVTALQNASADNLYTSFDRTTPEGKKLVFNALNNSESLAENIGKPFALRDVIALPAIVESLNNPGEMVEGTRIVLVADDGTGYGCMSTGVLGALERLFGIYGRPDTWAEPLTVVAVKKRGKKGLEFTTLELV